MDAVGLKLSIVTAGFIGSIISLSMVANMNPFRALITVITGTACALYLTPIALHFTKLPQGSEHALAFVLGVTGMNALLGFFKFSENFAHSPAETLKGVKSSPLSGKANDKEKAKK